MRSDTEQNRDRQQAGLIPALRARSVYVLVTPLQPIDDQRVDWLLAGCRDLREVREFIGMTLLLRVTSVGAPGPDPCARLQRYVREEAAERNRRIKHGAA